MADFQNHVKQFEERDAHLLAASVDIQEVAVQTVNSLELTYPVAFGLQAEEISHITGAFYKEEKGFLHATGFLLNRNGTVMVACYSSGAIGRLTAKDCLKLIDHLQGQDDRS